MQAKCGLQSPCETDVLDLSYSDLQIMVPKVCIVGAGVSGLRCATVLLGHSYDVTIIEARNRIGGRVRDE